MILTTGSISSSSAFGSTLLGKFTASLTEDFIAQGLTTGFNFKDYNLTSLGANFFSAKYKYGFIPKNVMSSFGEFSANNGFSIAKEEFNGQAALVNAGFGMALDYGLDALRAEPTYNAQQFTRLENLTHKPKYAEQYQHLRLNYNRVVAREMIGNQTKRYKE